ncbi:hypothetical protein KY342_06475 [Candidatus Woesearchaeota archaeon]|nr:hypothetical protein [Candidatus Woesearchaeota archaeon]
MKEQTYQKMVHVKRAYGEYLMFALQYSDQLREGMQNSEGQAREAYQKKLYELDARIENAVERRMLFSEVVAQEKERRKRTAARPEEKPVLEEVAMVA